MHRSTVLGPPCSHTKTKSTSSTKSGMSTRLTSTAHERRNHGRTEGVVAILIVALVSSHGILMIVSDKPNGSPSDYDGYSCLKKWDAFVGYQHQPW
jgi:hypothetical protein